MLYLKRISWDEAENTIPKIHQPGHGHGWYYDYRFIENAYEEAVALPLFVPEVGSNYFRLFPSYIYSTGISGAIMHLIPGINRTTVQTGFVMIDGGLLMGFKKFNESINWGFCDQYDVDIQKGPKGSSPLTMVQLLPKTELTPEEIQVFESFSKKLDAIPESLVDQIYDFDIKKCFAPVSLEVKNV